MVLGVLWLGLVWSMVAWLSASEQGDISWSVLSIHLGSWSNLKLAFPPSGLEAFQWRMRSVCLAD